ncbi:MAG TPA: FAD-dependent monooxygenase [Jiangellaceae bacterium]|nr:FAD-dependent monooxygenase [Jiangellaceae bacterium]
MTETPSVLVVGAGPTGLMLACELALAGVRCRVLERREQESNLTRAFGVHARTLELLDMRGEADKLVRQGLRVPEVRPQLGRRPLRLSLNHPESRFPYVLIVAQARTEALLEERARVLGVQIALAAQVVGLRQDDAGVDVVVDGAEGSRTERADYVVGCDGAHSAVRRLAGVGFVGSAYSTHIMLADIFLPENLPTAVGAYLGRAGIVLLPPFGDGWYRAVIWDREREHMPLEEPLGEEEIRQSLRRIAGTDFGMRQMRWSTRFLSERRQADRYQVDRIFLAGDAAHVHSPLGALGMNTGIQDAMNLGWKLSAAVHGWAPPWLLDSYHSERHPVGRAALQVTDLLQRVTLAPAAVRAVRPFLARFALSLPPVRRTLRRRVAGLSIAYPPPGGGKAHPWTGQRVPDVSIGASRLYAEMRHGHFTLVDRTVKGQLADAVAEGWPNRVVAMPVPPTTAPNWPAVTLIRPDGYVAWASDKAAGANQLAAIGHWCGPASTARSAHHVTTTPAQGRR